MKRLLIGCLSALIAFVILFGFTDFGKRVAAENESDEYEYEYYYSDNDSTGDEQMTVINSEEISGEDYLSGGDPGYSSLTVLVNKEQKLPSSYVPNDLVQADIIFMRGTILEKKFMREEAARAIMRMFDAAAAEGLHLRGVSAYRSYERQSEIYDENVKERGHDEIDDVSAGPGYSEHQTGLAIDVSSEELKGELTVAFAGTPEGKWVAKHCAKYGFIIRYPEGKESVTGYSYEPWHLRYVGKKTAKYIKKNKITLEEYVGY